jgi:pseudouridine-5'-phosphate glycosidase
MDINKRNFKIKPEVAQALRDSAPVLALESAVITHGLPRPHNLELAKELELIARSLQVTPATIGLLHGEIHIGLDEDELRHLAYTDSLHKISRRDLSIACFSGYSGGTTVAATLFTAHSAGIKVFATGGIGGVHRDSPFDMSADLPELARTPMIVVCSGAKAILDLPATRETLETMGIPVIGFQTDEFPAFYSASSGLPVDFRVESAGEIVNLFAVHKDLKMDSSLLVVNSPPVSTAVDGKALEDAIQQAVQESEDQDIHGAALTPYLLRKVSDFTEGESLKANLELLKSNVRLACQIALSISSQDLG